MKPVEFAVVMQHRWIAAGAPVIAHTGPMNARQTVIVVAISISMLLPGCGPRPAPAPAPEASAGYKDASLPVESRVENLLALMSLDEKIGQMTQVENNSIEPDDVTKYAIGSVLTGGDGISLENKPADWASLVKRYQDAALQTRLGIPMIYGIDSVHGMAHVNGATVFPHNIGLGATRDAKLVRAIGQATAEEMLGLGIPWNFGPVVAAPQDIRWGRTYEGFSEDSALVTELSSAYIEGFQAVGDGATGATAKHYLGDGGTQFGTSSAFIQKPFLLDQGDVRYDEAEARALFLPPYKAAVDAGVMSVMVSFSSWNGMKMHAHKYFITDVLKGELGFEGFVVSDWGGIDQIDDDYDAAVVTAINAGIDMNMVPYDYQRFIKSMKRAVKSGAIPQERIDDAVRRILRAKFALGLFEHPYGDPSLAASVGSEAHRALARQAVRESLVLLKNENGALPIDKVGGTIYVAGGSADSVGIQCGGWSLTWQGSVGANMRGGTSILQAIKAAVSPGTKVEYSMAGEFEGRADVGIVVIGEAPYAEGVGDDDNLELSPGDILGITNTRAHADKLVVVLLSGRPMVITGQLAQADAWVAAWLPGTEGAGVTDVLFGDAPFAGRTPYTWPRSNEQLPININNVDGKTGCAGPLFPAGYRLVGAGAAGGEWMQCP
jgi:beta-glucosidase